MGENYSVPDAEVFVKLADVLEVQTSQLLEVKVDSDVQTTEEKQNAYAEQLAHIAEQMAIRNRQRKRIWKTIGIAFAVIIVVCIILIVMNIAIFFCLPDHRGCSDTRRDYYVGRIELRTPVLLTKKLRRIHYE